MSETVHLFKLASGEEIIADLHHVEQIGTKARKTISAFFLQWPLRIRLMIDGGYTTESWVTGIEKPDQLFPVRSEHILFYWGRPDIDGVLLEDYDEFLRQRALDRQHG